jgi:hypothetical protein
MTEKWLAPGDVQERVARIPAQAGRRWRPGGLSRSIERARRSYPISAMTPGSMVPAHVEQVSVSVIALLRSHLRPPIEMLGRITTQFIPKLFVNDTRLPVSLRALEHAAVCRCHEPECSRAWDAGGHNQACRSTPERRLNGRGGFPWAAPQIMRNSSAQSQAR